MFIEKLNLKEGMLSDVSANNHVGRECFHFSGTFHIM